MATNYPTAIDDFLNYIDGTTVFEAATLNDMQAGIEALEAKVGIDNSAVTSSHDFKLANPVGRNWSLNAYTGSESLTLPPNYIIKTGRKDVGSTGNHTITFGTPFPNALISVTLGMLRNSSVNPPTWQKKSQSVSNFVIRNNGGVAGDTIDWIAIGW